jgi:hypothetical protein
MSLPEVRMTRLLIIYSLFTARARDTMLHWRGCRLSWSQVALFILLTLNGKSFGTRRTPHPKVFTQMCFANWWIWQTNYFLFQPFFSLSMPFFL